jgi:V/A-type H+/Na+-transporting ATPase subunit C
MDLSYLNARIRAWKSELLDKNTLYGLIDASDIKALITSLKETVYARDLEIASARYERETDVLEGGLRANPAQTFKRLWDYAPKQGKTMLRGVFSIWEAYNLKAILRARDKGISPDESISILIPIGDMDETALNELNRTHDIHGISTLLSTWGSPYARPIRDVLERYIKERQLITVELALDRFAHDYSISLTSGHDMNRRIINYFVKERINSINIATLLKLCGEALSQANAYNYFLEGGGIIDKGNFLKLAGSKSKRELMEKLADLVKDSHWEKTIRTADPDETFFIEEQLEELMTREMCRLSVTEPLSIALSVCFIYKKIREIKNLRLIARAKVFGIPAMEIKRFIL